MNTKKLAAKVVGTALVIVIPMATLSAGASAAPKSPAHAQAEVNRAGTNTWSSRPSGLMFGGAAVVDGTPLYAGPPFYNGAALPTAVKQRVRNAGSSRLSGLMFGGASRYL
jgi:hypothetical protein